MPTLKKLAPIVLALALAPSLALAADNASAHRMDAQLEQRFSKADADHDGKLTPAEAKAGMPRIAQVFDQIDTEHVGYITLDQIKAFVASHNQ